MQKPLCDLEAVQVANSYSCIKLLNYQISQLLNSLSAPATPLLATVLLRPVIRTGTACLPDDLQILCETSLRMRSSAWRRHLPKGRMSGLACFPKDIACCQCLFSVRLRRGSGRASSPASPYPRGTG